MDMWFDSDICWCADSIRCNKTDCFRHLTNKDDSERIFTCGSLMGSEYCQLGEDGGDEQGDIRYYFIYIMYCSGRSNHCRKAS